MTYLSVCIPMYNVAPFIERCARSLFEQTLKKGIEFIFVDDCSGDQSIDMLNRVLLEYPERQQQTKIICLKQNGGVANARNVAMRAATGKYVTHCDSDDWIDACAYEYLLHVLEGGALDAVCWSVEIPSIKDGMPQKVADCEISGVDFIKRSLPSTVFNVPWNKIYRRDIIEKNRLSYEDGLKSGEDLIFNLKTFSYCKKVRCINKIFYHYWVRPESITGTRKREIDCEVFKVLKLASPILEATSSLEARDRLIRNALLIAIRYEALKSAEFSRIGAQLHSSLFKDERYGMAKKGILVLSFVSYHATCILVRLMKKIGIVTAGNK